MRSFGGSCARQPKRGATSISWQPRWLVEVCDSITPTASRTSSASTGESVSRTASYLDLAFLVTTGNPQGLQHGARLGWTVSLAGVPEQVVTPAYAALYRVGPSWIFYGWAGLPMIAEPDFNVGTELALDPPGWRARGSALRARSSLTVSTVQARAKPALRSIRFFPRSSAS